MAVRISLFSAGAWWALFTIFPLVRIRNRAPSARLSSDTSYFRAGLKQLFHTVRSLRKYPQTVTFLVA